MSDISWTLGTTKLDVVQQNNSAAGSIKGTRNVLIQISKRRTAPLFSSSVIAFVPPADCSTIITSRKLKRLISSFWYWLILPKLHEHSYFLLSALQFLALCSHLWKCTNFHCNVWNSFFNSCIFTNWFACAMCCLLHRCPALFSDLKISALNFEVVLWGQRTQKMISFVHYSWTIF